MEWKRKGKLVLCEWIQYSVRREEGICSPLEDGRTGMLEVSAGMLDIQSFPLRSTTPTTKIAQSA